MHKRQTAQTEREREGGHLEPAGQSRSNERLLQIGSGLVSPCTAAQLSLSLHACPHTPLLGLNSPFLTLLLFLPPSYLPSPSIPPILQLITLMQSTASEM